MTTERRIFALLLLMSGFLFFQLGKEAARGDVLFDEAYSLGLAVGILDQPLFYGTQRNDEDRRRMMEIWKRIDIAYGYAIRECIQGPKK